MTMRSLLPCALLAAPLLWSGCATGFGPRTIPPERRNYNRFIAQSADEQMLLNLVRLRYNDTPLFLELDSVVTQYTLDGSVNSAATIGYEGTGDNEYGVGASIGYSERPTITYSPLQGQNFAKRMLTPITPESIILLSQAGWSIERLFLMSVKRVNGIPNAITASGPTPQSAPAYEDFQRLTAILRKLQKADLLNFNLEKDPATGESSIVARSVISPDAPLAEERTAMRKLLNLDIESSTLRLTASYLPNAKDELSVVGRSVFSVLFFLSQAVEPPLEHEEKGLVTVTRDEAGNRFDWSKVMGKLMRIQSSSTRPGQAFVRVSYRGHWFYIDDTDINSKQTFMLLNYMLSLMSAEGEGHSPLLTLPAGG